MRAPTCCLLETSRREICCAEAVASRRKRGRLARRHGTPTPHLVRRQAAQHGLLASAYSWWREPAAPPHKHATAMRFLQRRAAAARPQQRRARRAPALHLEEPVARRSASYLDAARRQRRVGLGSFPRCGGQRDNLPLAGGTQLFPSVRKIASISRDFVTKNTLCLSLLSCKRLVPTKDTTGIAGFLQEYSALKIIESHQQYFLFCETKLQEELVNMFL
jgi:hypothetical protein